MSCSGERVEWLDLARGIGIILVVYGHAVHSFFGRDFAEYTSGIFAWSEAVVYSFHMPLFFLISGSFFSARIIKKGFLAVLCRRIDVLLYPYLLWSLIQGSVEVIASNHTPAGVTMKEVLVSLFLQPRAHFWFLYDLFLMNVLAVAVYKILQKKGIFLLLLGAAVLFALHDNVHGFKGNFLFFVVGLLVGERLVHFGKTLLRSGNLPILIALFIFVHFLRIQYEPVFFGMFRFLLAGSGILLTLGVSVSLSKLKENNKYNVINQIGNIGRSSLFIYLVHVLAYQSFFQLLNIFGFHHQLIYIAGGSLVGVLVPYMLFSFLERYKISLLYKANLSALLYSESRA